MKITSIIKSLMKKIKKQHPVVQVAILGILGYLLYQIYNEIRWGFFGQSYMLEGLSNGNTIYFFHMNGCPHCESMIKDPETGGPGAWKQFEQANQGRTKMVEAKQDPNLIQTLGIEGFPTIMILDSNKKKVGETFSGERTLAGLQAFFANN
jgi:hypothetical protein